MVVQRISELNIKSRGFIVPITGYIEDAFIDEDLCSYTFEHQLYLYLKKEGFDRIFFVNRARRRTFYTYEAEGFKSIENKNDNNIKGHGRSDGRLGGGRLSRLSKAQMDTLNDVEYKDNLGRKYYCRNNLLDSGLKKLIIDILSNKTCVSAICFINQNFDTGQVHDIVDSIALIDNDYAAAGLKNKLIVNKNISGNLFNNPFFKEKLNSDVFEVTIPDYIECKNWVNAKRIKGTLNSDQVFSFPFEEIVKRIHQKKKKISELENELYMKKNNFIEDLKPCVLTDVSPKEELEKLVGIDSIREQFYEYVRMLHYCRKNPKSSISRSFRPHMAFKGNPGTGKTTIARLFADILRMEGLLLNNNVVEVGPTDLIGEHMGDTGPKTRCVCERSRGGILFIDEAYQLCREDQLRGGSQYGKESITELIKFMEDDRDTIVIFAGYADEIEYLIKEGNTGLSSRVTNNFIFSNYSPEMLSSILFDKLKEFSLTDEFKAEMKKIIKNQYNKHKDEKTWGNARIMENYATAIFSIYLSKYKAEGSIGVDCIPNDLVEN